MFDVNWSHFVQALTPIWWRRTRFVQWLLVMISPVRDLHAVFGAYRERTIYDMRITGQTIYLEKALNDRFDAVNRDIYIENLADLTQTYLFNKVEARPPMYLYNKWKGTTPYFVGQRVAHSGRIWRCAIANLASEPVTGNANWINHAEQVHLINKGESLQFTDFIVWVPNALVFDEDEMKALITRYKPTGKRYIIDTY